MATIYVTPGRRCLVDDDLAPFLSLFRWHIHNGCYAIGKVCGRLIFMHRLIMNAPDELHIDHLNGDGLDNRRENIRFATHTQNMQNTKTRLSRSYKGVSFDSRDGTYHAQISIDGKHFSFCYSRSPEKCAKAYDAVARYHFGDFARTNFSGTEKTSVTEMIRKTRNTRGTSKFRGVHFSKKARRFVAAVAFTDATNGKRIKKYAGFFVNEEEAARAYDALAKQIFGDKAILNFS